MHFRTCQSLNQTRESSPLTTLILHLRSSLEIMNVSFSPSLSTRISGPQNFVNRFLTWVILRILDSTYYQEQARQFDGIGGYIFRTECMTTARRPRDLATCYRGWALRHLAAAEPTERDPCLFICLEKCRGRSKM